LDIFLDANVKSYGNLPIAVQPSMLTKAQGWAEKKTTKIQMFASITRNGDSHLFGKS
jgi:hypothetical protein